MAWLLALRARVAEVEEDTDEARRSRHELARLLVERINVGCDENDAAQVRITHRFDPPSEPAVDFRTVGGASKGSPTRASINSFLLVPGNPVSGGPGRGSGATLSTSAR